MYQFSDISLIEDILSALSHVLILSALSYVLILSVLSHVLILSALSYVLILSVLSHVLIFFLFKEQNAEKKMNSNSEVYL